MSVSVGGSKGSGSSSQKSEAASILQKYAGQFFKETTGVRKGLINVFDELLKTGGSQALIPIISTSTEKAKQAASGALQQVNDELARTNLVGTPFGQMTKASTMMEGAQNVSQIGPQIAQAFLQLLPNFILGQSSNIVGGLGSAVPGNVTQNSDAKGSSFGIAG